MSRNTVVQTIFLVVGGTCLAFSMVLAGVAGGGNAALAQVQQATKTIQAKGTPVSCPSGVYHFVITQVTDQTAPPTITVKWSDGTSTTVNVSKKSPTAFYDATAPSSGVTVVSASAVIDSSWSGEFNFSSCENGNATATPTPTNTPTNNKPSTATPTPTNTPTNNKPSTATPTETNTPTNNKPSTSTPTGTATATPTNTPQSGHPSGSTATPTNTNTPVPSSPNQPSAPTNTPVVAAPTAVAGAQATPISVQTSQPTAVAGVSVTAQTLPKTGDPLAGLLRLLGIALIGLGLTTRFITRQR